MSGIIKLIECLLDTPILLSFMIFQVASDYVVISNFTIVGSRTYFCIKILRVVFLSILITSYRLFKTLLRCLDYFSYFDKSYADSCFRNALCLPFPLTGTHL